MSEGGDAYGKLVLFRLDALAVDVQRIEDKVEALLIDVAMLKVKAGVWGAVAGAIPATIGIVLTLVMS